MKIAHIVDFWHKYDKNNLNKSIPKLAFSLADKLTLKGHSVFMFVPKGSKSLAKVWDIKPFGKYKLPFTDPKIQALYSLANLEIAKRSTDFDIIHVHKIHTIGFLPFAEVIETPVVCTLHGGGLSHIDKMIGAKCRKVSYVSVSKNSQIVTPGFNYKASIYNGIDTNKYTFNPKPDDYFFWCGRLVPEKGAHVAIELAKERGFKLILAGISNSDDYSKKVFKQIDGEQIKYFEFVKNTKLIKLYQNAKALINPVSIEEPFGMVNIEAMSCGTPVIGAKIGANPEIIKDGETGYLAKNKKEFIKGINSIEKTDRFKCRQRVEKLFSMQTMVNEYEKLYQKIINK